MSTATCEVIRETGIVVLAIGRLALNKGHDLLIDALTVVATPLPDAVLDLALGTPRRKPTSKRCSYRAANVFLLSSRYEPFGTTAIEAMACRHRQ